MKLSYRKLLPMLMCGVVCLWVQTAAAQSPLVVEWETSPGSFEPVVNALRDAIANDTERPEDRVYVLKRGGFYWITDAIEFNGFHLRLVGETEDDVPVGEEDFGPAILQRVARDDGSPPDGKMFRNSGEGSHLTMQHIWVMGQTDQGTLTSYEPFQLDASNSRFTFDNVVFDRNNWHHLGPNGRDCDFYITNSKFRNIFGPTQIWEGLGIRLEAGADTVVFENNTFFNIGFTPFQSEAEPANYFRFNHNTLVNIGRNFQAGALWKEAYITNNVFVNPYWHGDDQGQVEDPNREQLFSGFFAIGELPARFGTNFERQIALANNSYWRDPRFTDFYANNIPMGDTQPIQAQPFINDTTAGWFAAWDNMVMQNNYMDVNPELTTYIADDIINDMFQHILDLYNDPQTIPAAVYFWDPGREADPVLNVWPLPEDFSYTNATLLTGGTDGLPVGDLNWFPDAKADFEANKDTYIMGVENLTSAPKIDVLSTLEAEWQTIGEGATINTADGFLYYQMDGSGSMEWTFDVPNAGVAEFMLLTHLRGNNDRGNRIFVNDTEIKNTMQYGEYFWSVSRGDPANEWFTSLITQDSVVTGTEAMDLPAGENKIRLSPSWGFQNFADLTVIVGTDTITLSPADAVSAGLTPHAEDENGDPLDWVPSQFKSVELAIGTGNLSFGFDVPAGGTYMIRMFYASSSATTGTISANGAVVSMASFGADTADVFSDQFQLTAGATSFVVDAPGVSLDFLQILQVSGTSVGIEDEFVPGTFALAQNYPNPFNPTTTISYNLGKSAEVSLEVFNVLGQRVRSLIANQVQPAGRYAIQWDGKDEGGRQMSTGLYFYRIKAGDFVRAHKMTLIK